MSAFDWLSEYLARLEDEHVLVRHGEAKSLSPAHRLVLDAEDGGTAGSVAAGMGCRWAEEPSFICSIVGIPATIGGIVLGAATWL